MSSGRNLKGPTVGAENAIQGISKSEVSRLAAELDERVAEFRGRPLETGPYRYCWIDALTQRVREGGRVVNVSAVIATAVNAEGKREIVGFDVVTTEDTDAWTASLRFRRLAASDNRCRDSLRCPRRVRQRLERRPRHLLVSADLEQPTQHTLACTISKSESPSERRELLDERARAIRTVPERVDRDLSDGLVILFVAEEIGHDARWSDDEEARQHGPRPLLQAIDVDANVIASHASPLGKRELVRICREMAEAVDRGGGTVRDDAVLSLALPERNLGRELEVGSSEIEQVRDRRDRDVVDATRDRL